MSDEIIYFRADGNEVIATGHVMRCLSIAAQVRKMGVGVVFLTADDKPYEMIAKRGFEVHALGTKWDNLDSELDVLCDYISKNNVSKLVVDSYFATDYYLQMLSEHTDIIYIDDMRKELYKVKALVHYWAFADKEEYMKSYASFQNKPDCLVGGKYIPLREEFSYKPYKVKKNMGNVLITTGGTDMLGVAERLLESVMNNPKLDKLNYHVIVGCFNKNKDLLVSLAKRHSNIVLHENVSNMSEWMRKCDVAVTAAGTTIYELCACGIPSVCLEIAENQNGAIVWEKEGYMLYAGNAYNNIKECIKRCEEALMIYSMDFEMRKRYSEKMQSLVDGCGARRIAEYLIHGGM